MQELHRVEEMASKERWVALTTSWRRCQRLLALRHQGAEGEGGAGHPGGWCAADAARGKRCALALMRASDDLLSFARARLVAPRGRLGWSREVSEEWRQRVLIIQVRDNPGGGCSRLEAARVPDM